MVKIYESNGDFIEEYKGSKIYFVDGNYTAMIKWSDPFSGSKFGVSFIPVTARSLDELKSKIDDMHFDWETQVFSNYD